MGKNLPEWDQDHPMKTWSQPGLRSKQRVLLSSSVLGWRTGWDTHAAPSSPQGCLSASSHSRGWTRAWGSSLHSHIPGYRKLASTGRAMLGLGEMPRMGLSERPSQPACQYAAKGLFWGILAWVLLVQFNSANAYWALSAWEGSAKCRKKRIFTLFDFCLAWCQRHAATL